MKDKTQTRRKLLQTMGVGATMTTLTGVGTAQNSRTDKIAFAEVSYTASSMEPVEGEAEKVSGTNIPYHRVHDDYLYLNKRLLPSRLEGMFTSHKGVIWDGQYHKAPGRITDRSAHLLNPSRNGGNHTGFLLAEGAEVPEFTVTVKDEGKITISGLGRRPVSVPAGEQRIVQLSNQTSSVLTKGKSPNITMEIVPQVNITSYGALSTRDIRNPAHIE